VQTQARQHSGVIMGFLEDPETSTAALDTALRGLFDLALVFGTALNGDGGAADAVRWRGVRRTAGPLTRTGPAGHGRCV
jgi:hypothetical protein